MMFSALFCRKLTLPITEAVRAHGYGKVGPWRVDPAPYSQGGKSF